MCSFLFHESFLMSASVMPSPESILHRVKSTGANVTTLPPVTPPSPSPVASTETVLSKNFTLNEFKLVTTDDVRVQGRLIDGTLTCRNLTIERGATFNGVVSAKSLTVHGTFTGTAELEESVDIGSSATIEDGNFTASDINIAKGSVVVGHFKTKK